MKLDSLVRKVKRQFGDEYDIIINTQDILDWCNESQLDIVRNTSANDVTVPVIANTFPVTLADQVSLKRISINNKALTETSLRELDSSHLSTATTGTPQFFYYEDGQIGLYPTPAVGDVYTVLVTYAAIPETLHLLAPYLQFKKNPVSVQFATIPLNVAFETTDINFVFEIDIISTSSPAGIVYYGNNLSAATNYGWHFKYNGGQQFVLTVTNGTTVNTLTLSVSNTIFSSGSHYKGRVTYNSTTGSAQIYTFNETTGVETLAGTASGTPGVIVNAAGPFPIGFGSINGTAAVPVGPFNLYYFSLDGSITGFGNTPIILFDGSVDLIDLPTIPATPFKISSGHSVAIGGDPSIQIRSTQELSVPEVYHEDIVRYCIGRAHDKNQNYRGAEAAMQAYNQNTSNRRDEAEATDNPSYKQLDPEDFSGDWWYS